MVVMRICNECGIDRVASEFYINKKRGSVAGKCKVCISDRAKKRYRKDKIKSAYLLQKKNAAARGVGFELSYEDWLGIWKASGKLEFRGRGKGQYCMCRIGDKGAYTQGNVFIGAVSDNASAGNAGKVLSEETKRLIGESKLGRRRADMEGANNHMVKKAQPIHTPHGVFPSAAVAARELGLSHETPYRRCASSTSRFKDWYKIQA